MATHLQPYQWQPGQSGNPGGRPKRRRLENLLRELMAETDVATGQPIGRRFVEEVVKLAVATGNPAIIKEVFDRHDGKVPDKAVVKNVGTPQAQRIVVDFGEAEAVADGPAPDQADGAPGEVLGE